MLFFEFCDIKVQRWHFECVSTRFLNPFYYYQRYTLVCFMVYLSLYHIAINFVESTTKLLFNIVIHPENEVIRQPVQFRF